MKTNPTCRVCGTELNDENWYALQKKGHHYICKVCAAKYSREWYHNHRSLTIDRAKQWQSENPEKARSKTTRSRRKHGVRAMSDNKSCALYLGVHIAEQGLSHVFKNVQRMPLHNPGYDFVCNKGKIDVKAATQQRATPAWSWRWKFAINHNMIADYFLCIAFDDREHLNPLHLWLLPANKYNQMQAISISQSTLSKWAQYELSDKLDKVIACCNILKEV